MRIKRVENLDKAKYALDSLLKKSRVHLYKPIQIAEILYHDRVIGDINLENVEDYRTKSKKWRDDVSIKLLGRICTSSARFQDNLFNDNALPAKLIAELGKENRRTNGAVEAYIYNSFMSRHRQLADALNYCLNANKDNFLIKSLIDSFWNEPGLKRSLDKIYEIIVYALFATLIEALKLKVEVSVDAASYPMLHEFEDFSKKVMCIDLNNTSNVLDAKVYRVGVTNAADRGLDMYSNWGPAIQIKHLSLDVELAENIVKNISSDHIVIVCKDAEKQIILSLLTQIGWKTRIQSIITENELVSWYEKALRGTYSKDLGDYLLTKLCEEISLEFPSLNTNLDIFLDRHYDKLSVDNYWIINNNK